MWSGSNQVRNEDVQEQNVDQNESEAKQSDQIGSEPFWKKLNARIPLGRFSMNQRKAEDAASYVVPQDVIRDPRLIDAGILIGLEMDESLFRKRINFGLVSGTVSIKGLGNATFSHRGCKD